MHISLFQFILMSTKEVKNVVESVEIQFKKATFCFLKLYYSYCCQFVLVKTS